MTPREKTVKRLDGDARTDAALERAKIQARAELRRIFDEEIRQRAAEPQQQLSRPAAAAHS